jgi:TetR/AcrR family transcriptional repressor of nem operon
MARPIEFDREKVLQACMLQFWKDGYEASSIEKLLAVARINRGTMYNSFGTKDKLFLLCVERYSRQVYQTLITSFDAGSGDDNQRWLQFFQEVFIERTHCHLGCMVVNCAGESIVWDRTAKKAFKKFMSTILHELTRYCKQRGAPEHLANTLLAIYCGASAMARLGASAEVLIDMANGGLQVLE